ncbi:MAG TPA: hypothetical protein VGK81_11750 [Anaerolineae bacterium]
MESDKVQLRANVELAQAVLARTWRGPVRLSDGEAPGGGSGRANVLRCKVLEAPANTPDSVIVKRVNTAPGETYDPHASTGAAIRLFTEWASLEFLSQLDTDTPLAPRFYGGDHEAGLIVMEDMGHGASLVQPLTGDNRPAAIEALAVFFRSLGRLNASTCGHHEQYQHIRSRLGADEPLSQPTLGAERHKLETLLTGISERVDVPMDTGVYDDIARVAMLDVQPGPFLAFSQSDTCPDNCIRQDGWMRFFDFEWGWFRNALSDGARARSNFASCWCVNRLPDDVIRQCEAIYRAELVKGCPAAADDRLFSQALVTACAYWTLFSLEFYRALWTENLQWGISTERQRVITRFELLAQTTEEFGYMLALGGMSRILADKLRALWPEVEPMPLYPPFR